MSIPVNEVAALHGLTLMGFEHDEGTLTHASEEETP